MALIYRIYTLYALTIFFLTFILLLPLFLVCIWIPNMEKYGRKINQFWASLFFFLIFKPIEVEGRENIKKGQTYIFAANHFSYLDIAMMGFIPGDVVYVGKSSIRKIPLFGYYFKNLHIAVNRSSLRSRSEVLKRAKNAISKGSSIVIFPEGGITTGLAPQLNKFKDGAFSLAIDKQIPVIPVTLSYNHLILPDDGKLLLNFKKGKIVIHSPLPTVGLTTKDILVIKSSCFNIIQDQIWEDNGLLDAEKTTMQNL